MRTEGVKGIELRARWNEQHKVSTVDHFQHRYYERSKFSYAAIGFALNRNFPDSIHRF